MAETGGETVDKVLIEEMDVEDEEVEDEEMEQSEESDSSSSSSTPQNSPRSPRESLPGDPIAICQACLIGDVDEVRTLLQSNPNNANCQDGEGRTPLHSAAASNEPQIVHMLLSAGAQPNAKDKMGLTPLHRACGPKSKAHEVVSLLISAGAELNKKDKTWQTPLHIAATAGATTCARFLIKAGALSNERDSYGRTPLHLAAQLTVLKSVHSEAAGDFCKLLIDKGEASLSARDNLGRQPIHYACIAGNSSTFRSLTEAGAKLDVSDSELFMPIHCACISGSNNILTLIIKAGILSQPSFSSQVDALAHGDQSPLHLASAGGFVDCVQTLLKNGADPEMVNSAGVTPLHYAAATVKGYDSMSLLMKATTDVYAYVNTADNHGRTALHFAAYFGNFERFRVLLRSSAEPCTCADNLICRHRANAALLKDAFGLEPIHYAAKQGHSEICNLLTKFYQFDSTTGPLTRSDKSTQEVFPLLLACGSGSLDTVKHLFSHVPPQMKNLDNFTDALGRNCFHAACYSGQAEVIAFLATNNAFADFNKTCSQISNFAPIHFLASSKRRKEAKEAVRILVTHCGEQLDANACDSQGRTALMLSAALDDSSKTSVMESLLNFASSDPLCIDSHLQSVLHFASGNTTFIDKPSQTKNEGPMRSGAFGRGAVARLLTPGDGMYAGGNTGNTGGQGCLLSPADAAELVDLAIVGCQTNPLHIACFYGLSANVASLVPLMPALTSTCDEFGWTPLHYACSLKNPELAAECIQLLLAGGANLITKECRYGWTPLHVAAVFGVASTVRLLVDFVTNSSNSRRPLLPEPSTFINTKDKLLRTPLHLAITAKHRESVCVLLHRGADFRAKDKFKRSAIHRSIFIEDVELVQWLCKAEPQLMQSRDAHIGRNILHLAVTKGNIEICQFLSSNCPRLVFSCDNDGISPLHLACWQLGDTAIVKALLDTLDQEQCGKLMKIWLNSKMSPFHCAALADRLTTFEMLQAKFIPDEKRKNVLLQLCDSKRRSILHCAFAGGSASVFKLLIGIVDMTKISQMLTVRDCSMKKWTPLHYAVNYGRLSIIRECCDILGEPGLVDILDQNMLEMAVSKNHEATALYLFDILWKTEENVCLDWAHECLPLVVQKGQVRLLEFLIGLGANAFGMDKRNSEPAFYSLCSSDSQRVCVSMLVSQQGPSKTCWNESEGVEGDLEMEDVLEQEGDGNGEPIESSSALKNLDSGLGKVSGPTATEHSDDGEFF